MSNARHRFNNDLRRRAEDHDRQVQLTPAYILEPVRGILGGIGLDPCTEPDNPTRAEKFYCLPDDGCEMPWDAATVFINPPYGQARERWIRRAMAEAGSRKIIMLLPSHTETKIMQEAMAVAQTSLFVNARIQFEARRQNGRRMAASHGSVILGFGVDLSPLSYLGVVVRPVSYQPPKQVRQ